MVTQKRPKTKIMLPQFSPARNSPCLCGSGLTFKRCCADRLPGTTGLGNRTGDLYKDSKFKEALTACRADITQYTIWHKSHTEPAVRLGMPKKGSLFEVDLRALTEILETLFWCHIKCEMVDEFPAVLERLRGNIKDTEWQRKIVYFHALHALWPDWNEDAGRRELKKLGRPNEEDDVETLQLYLDLFSDDLAFSEKQSLIDQILTSTKKLSDRIHYKGARACLYLMIGDELRAKSELAEIIDEVRGKHAEADLDNYERYRLAAATELLGMIQRDDKMLTDALLLYQNLLKEDEYSDEGRTNLLSLIGDTYRHKGNWESARQSYEEAIKLKPSPIHEVFLSECLLQLDRLADATKALTNVKQDQLDGAEKVDYAFVLAVLAIETGEHARLVNAKAVLGSLVVNGPYFRERRDAYLLNVQEALVSGVSQPLIQRTRRLLAYIAQSATRYLILKPSFMGMGVDVGKVFEDIAKKGGKKSPKH